jgi:hypothetical protein
MDLIYDDTSDILKTL